jgi:hypothetical protein
MTEQLDLTDEEKRALIAALRETLDYARFPLAPRLDPLKAILAKLEPSRRRTNSRRLCRPQGRVLGADDGGGRCGPLFMSGSITGRH